MTAATKVRAIMKNTASTSRGSPGQLLANHTMEVSVDVRAAMGVTASIKRSLRREKGKTAPPNPPSLQDLVMSADWMTTGGTDPRPFLIYDSGARADRMLVFASEPALRHLARAETWYMDGTFDSAPLLFHQLYVIRVPVGNSAVSCVYSLLPDKHQATYEELFTAVTAKCTQLGFQPDPVTIITDYEKAAINAVQTTFGPDVQVHGCFYHLTQNTWRKVQQLGLVPLYRSQEEVKLFCGMLDGLAFLPVDQVQEGMDYLKGHTPDSLEPLVEYFDSTYVKGAFRRIHPPAGTDGAIPPLRMRRHLPLFPPRLWNCHDVTLRGESRTNNLCESWNRSFQSLVGCSHPTIWRLIDSLRKDNINVETCLLLDSRGQCPRKRVLQSTKKLQQTLVTLCSDLRDGRKTVEETLKAVGYCIRWKV